MNDPVITLLGPIDPRVAEYPLMTSLLPTVLFSTIYFLFVQWIGPAWMKNKKPYNLRYAMVVYNFFLVGINGWVTINIMWHGWLASYSWRCEPIDISDNPVALKMIELLWLAYITKLIEYLDTVIIVLRKKDLQMSFLHVYHHTTVPTIGWIGVAYGPGGYNTMFPLVNTFVHVWMYLYYGLSAFGEEIKKYLWWKKYLTSLQLVQFAIVSLYFAHLCLFSPKSCNLSPLLVVMNVVPSVVFFGLFLRFYSNSYNHSSKISKCQSGKSMPKKEK